MIIGARYGLSQYFARYSIGSVAQARSPPCLPGLVGRAHGELVDGRVVGLVEHPRGERYSDGKRYAKFYVPVQMLEAVE